MFIDYVVGMSIFSKLEEWSEKIKSFIFDNYSNPLLWVGILAVGLFLFATMFASLNKD